ncbi:MAG: pyrroline-5-carboxylate reductase [Methylococcales symbiont of Iophon sp. n. MRB-2018]|nr:MAG: pyrroline-5-carboxylate reductase [Methylococcales symbiont of Iophon sp. n. MRB-2018]KAF3980749.1 MAG: pyrroline-5-carboxylate reductase [Methylococcales symbiont of Iophon sp. n. MRB-2018]
MNTKKIGFIGGGNMASSLIRGLIASGHPANLLWVSDTNQKTLDTLSSNLQVNISVDNNVIVEQVDVIVLAVKPQILNTVAEQIAPLLQKRNTLVVSIAAGISQDSLGKWLGQNCAVVRCMPNTPAMVQTGATALHANSEVSVEQKGLAENILRAVGISLWVDHESEMDAVTAVSGSGPAYFFLLMEAMEQAALEMGLDENTARLLIQQTALGAAKIALESDESSKQLRQRVTSPGGTTQQAIETFEKGGFVQLVSKALHAARDRSIEMSKQLGEQ